MNDQYAESAALVGNVQHYTVKQNAYGVEEYDLQPRTAQKVKRPQSAVKSSKKTPSTATKVA